MCVRVVWNATQLVAIVQQLALASGDEEYQKAATEVIREMSAAVTALVVLHAAPSTCKPRACGACVTQPTSHTHCTPSSCRLTLTLPTHHTFSPDRIHRIP
jgi:hypothetical protein